MKLNEFKAWFEGFTEDMERAPTAKQWRRIKERVAEIDGVAVTYPVYVDRYVRPWYPYWNNFTCGTVGAGAMNDISLSNQAQCKADYTAALQGATAGTTQYQNGLSNSLQGQFDGVSAMYAAGRAESLED